MRPAVHVSEQVPAEVDAALRRDFELVPSPQGAEGIVAMLTVTIDDAYLEAAGAQLRVVANYAVGVNNIDLEAARRRGIVIANTPDVLTRATAEIALTLMLSLLRRVTEGDRFVRRRTPWQFSLEFMLGESLEGKTVLIVGPDGSAARRRGSRKRSERTSCSPGATTISTHSSRTRTSSRCTRRSHRRRGTSSTRGVCG